MNLVQLSDNLQHSLVLTWSNLFLLIAQFCDPYILNDVALASTK